MDYSKMTKEQLINKLNEQMDLLMTKQELETSYNELIKTNESILKEKEELIVSARENKKVADEARNESFMLRKELEKTEKKMVYYDDIEQQNKTLLKKISELEGNTKLTSSTIEKEISRRDEAIKKMEKHINELTNIFEEYMISHKNYIKMQEGSLANIQYIENILNQKINRFNEGGNS